MNNDNTNNKFIEFLYYLSDKTGEYSGSLISKLLSIGNNATTIGLNAYQKTRDSFLVKVQPTLEESKKILSNHYVNAFVQNRYDFGDTYKKQSNIESSQSGSEQSNSQPENNV